MHPTEPAVPVRALIVDDEEPGRLNLRCMLAAHAGWQVAGECASAAEARRVLAGGKVDVVFLDIRMPGESGLGLARSLCDAAEPPLVIFVTAFDVHAVEAFDMHALDYLLKPFSARRLAQALARAEQMLALRQRLPYGRALQGYFDARALHAQGRPAGYLREVTVRSVGKIEVVRLDEVLWIGAASNYVEIHTAGRSILHRIALATLAERLDPRDFLRVHRSAIVRAAQAGALEVAGDGSYVLRLRGGHAVPVSARYVQQVRSAMSSLAGAGA